MVAIFSVGFVGTIAESTNALIIYACLLILFPVSVLLVEIILRFSSLSPVPTNTLATNDPGGTGNSTGHNSSSNQSSLTNGRNVVNNQNQSSLMNNSSLSSSSLPELIQINSFQSLPSLPPSILAYDNSKNRTELFGSRINTKPDHHRQHQLQQSPMNALVLLPPSKQSQASSVPSFNTIANKFINSFNQTYLASETKFLTSDNDRTNQKDPDERNKNGPNDRDDYDADDDDRGGEKRKVKSVATKSYRMKNSSMIILKTNHNRNRINLRNRIDQKDFFSKVFTTTLNPMVEKSIRYILIGSLVFVLVQIIFSYLLVYHLRMINFRLKFVIESTKTNGKQFEMKTAKTSSSKSGKKTANATKILITDYIDDLIENDDGGGSDDDDDGDGVDDNNDAQQQSNDRINDFDHISGDEILMKKPTILCLQHRLDHRINLNEEKFKFDKDDGDDDDVVVDNDPNQSNLYQLIDQTSNDENQQQKHHYHNHHQPLCMTILDQSNRNVSQNFHRHQHHEQSKPIEFSFDEAFGIECDVYQLCDPRISSIYDEQHSDHNHNDHIDGNGNDNREKVIIDENQKVYLNATVKGVPPHHHHQQQHRNDNSEILSSASLVEVHVNPNEWFDSIDSDHHHHHHYQHQTLSYQYGDCERENFLDQDNVRNDDGNDDAHQFEASGIILSGQIESKTESLPSSTSTSSSAKRFTLSTTIDSTTKETANRLAIPPTINDLNQSSSSTTSISTLPSSLRSNQSNRRRNRSSSFRVTFDSLPEFFESNPTHPTTMLTIVDPKEEFKK